MMNVLLMTKRNISRFTECCLRWSVRWYLPRNHGAQNYVDLFIFKFTQITQHHIL